MPAKSANPTTPNKGGKWKQGKKVTDSLIEAHQTISLNLPENFSKPDWMVLKRTCVSVSQAYRRKIVQDLRMHIFQHLTACCGMLEYLAGLHVGRTNGLGKQEVMRYAKYLPQPDYSDEAIRVLFDAFRNAIAHRGIASGVWKDRHPAMLGRRLTWKVLADLKRPVIEVAESRGELKYDPPWPCPYTHRVHIHLGRLWRDIRDSVDNYLADLDINPESQDNFFLCMKELYPR